MLIGLPRTLSFYYLRPFYRSFLTEMDIPFIETEPSSNLDLDNMRLCPTDEPCISVKIAFSHAKKLLDKGVDALFVPSLVSLSSRSYCCPKMMGLPHMLRSGLDLTKNQVISPIIDLKDNPSSWKESWVEAVIRMNPQKGSYNYNRKELRRRVFRALNEAQKAQDVFERKAVLFRAASCEGTAPHFGAGTAKPDPAIETAGSGRSVTAVMGHAYILRDIFGRKILEFLKAYGDVVLEEMVDPAAAQKALSKIPDGEKLWTIEGKILGASLFLLQTKKVDRMIVISAFSCGPLSIIENYVAWEAERNRIPLLNLTVDEHTGEAGLLTRIEAFMDACGYVQKKPLMTAKDSVFDSDSSKTATGIHMNPVWTANPKVAMVNMGNLHIPLLGLFKECNREVLTPEPLSDKTSELGKEISPEFICYPMVTLLGQMREVAEKGADRIIMVGGKGRCRLGWYAQVMQELLNHKGYDVKVVAIDSPFPWREKGESFRNGLKDLFGSVSSLKLLKGATFALTKMALIDKAEDVARDTRARERTRGSADAVLEAFLKGQERSSSFKDAIARFRLFLREIGSIEKVPQDQEPIHVLVLGEIYVLNEPFVNRNAERLLSSFEERVRVHRRLTVTNWVAYHVLKTPWAILDYHRVVEAAENYIPISVGGHGQESLGEMVLSKKKGMDGVLHLFPFTCMPEIIAQNILVKASQDLDMPVLSIMISEQTGVAGLATRLEAFCHLLAGKKHATQVKRG